MPIAENIAGLRREIPEHVKIIAVSKTMPAELVREAYDAGQREFGENKVQEVLLKQPMLPEDTQWHMIGHLQTNKVKLIVPFVSLIHSVDSLRLLSAINREAALINRKVNCLLQMRIAAEETKFGITFPQVRQLLESEEYQGFRFVSINGLMGMATFTNNESQIRKEFSNLARYFYEIKKQWFAHDVSFKEMSMGMSGDYKLAIEAGSTMVRIGSLIFGERNYN